MLVHMYGECVTCNRMRCQTSDDIAGTSSRTAPGVQVFRDMLDKLKNRRENSVVLIPTIDTGTRTSLYVTI